jgi:hypothetical protein
MSSKNRQKLLENSISTFKEFLDYYEDIKGSKFDISFEDFIVLVLFFKNLTGESQINGKLKHVFLEVVELYVRFSTLTGCNIKDFDNFFQMVQEIYSSETLNSERQESSESRKHETPVKSERIRSTDKSKKIETKKEIQREPKDDGKSRSTRKDESSAKEREPDSVFEPTKATHEKSALGDPKSADSGLSKNKNK